MTITTNNIRSSAAFHSTIIIILHMCHNGGASHSGGDLGMQLDITDFSKLKDEYHTAVHMHSYKWLYLKI